MRGNVLRTASYAVMFTDIKGYTERTSRQTRAENARLLRLHDALLVPVIQGYGGRRVKTIGDAYLVVFDSATRALAAGAAMQDRLAQYNSAVSEKEQIEVRIAVNAGEVRLEDGDVYGEAVNIAARVEETADAGEVCFTESVYLLADRAWLEVEELGPHTLRGIPEPVRLYRLRRTREGLLPYDGAALKTLGLREPTPQVLARYRSARFRFWRGWAVAIALLLAAGALGLLAYRAWWAPVPRIERLVAEGKVQEARDALHALGKPELGEPAFAYLEGVIAHARGAPGEAIDRWLAAAARDDGLAADRVVPRLEALLEDERCELRERAARALGNLRQRSARRALEALAAREPEQTGFFAGIGVGGCNAGDAAREALARIDEE